MASLISLLQCMPPTVIKPLSWVAQNKTGGVILFVTNFLHSLHEERLIYFNPTTLQWEFDLIKIAQKELSSDMVIFLRERIMRLPQEVQEGLNIAACLGSTFDLAVLQKAHRSPDNVALSNVGSGKWIHSRASPESIHMESRSAARSSLFDKQCICSQEPESISIQIGMKSRA
ncbi:LOW QUALITY PROTEIN: hypothetical protein ACHAXN_004260 [Cyclotella atomus]